MICEYFLWFIILSMGGWVFETLFCILRKHRWENRGFLYGPLCPIYGVGGIVVILIYQLLRSEGIELGWWQVFLISCFGSMTLEYFTSWALEKLFHAYWWDYSHVPLNLNGRICLPASLLFGAFGVIIVFIVYPLLNDLTAAMPPWVLEAIALVVMMLLGGDIALTVSALSQFNAMLTRAEAQANSQMEHLVSDAFEAGRTFMEERKQAIAQLSAEHLPHASAAVQSAINRVKGFRTSTLHLDRETLDTFRAHLKRKPPQQKS